MSFVCGSWQDTARARQAEAQARSESLQAQGALTQLSTAQGEGERLKQRVAALESERAAERKQQEKLLLDLKQSEYALCMCCCDACCCALRAWVASVLVSERVLQLRVTCA
jgi:hypothetical protein